MKQVGIFGGTFDPIHFGHLALAREAKIEGELEAVWFMPAVSPPHKQGKQITPYEDRLKMTELAIQGQDGFLSSDFERRREGEAYTYRILQDLREYYPQAEFSFILGADSLWEIEDWKHPEKILSMARIIAAPREYTKKHNTLEEQAGYLTKKYSTRGILLLHAREIPISSSMIREMLQRGEDAGEYLPQKVEAYIHSKKLYR